MRNFLARSSASTRTSKVLGRVPFRNRYRLLCDRMPARWHLMMRSLQKDDSESAELVNERRAVADPKIHYYELTPNGTVQ
jgi:hypothetical protein